MIVFSKHRIDYEKSKMNSMEFVETENFRLAVYARGNPNSDKLALLLPGRLDTKDYIHMTGHVDFLAGLGYFALSFDPPGSWESSGDIKDYTMTNYLKAIDELREKFGNKPTLVMGHSRGGSMAMLAATTNPIITHMICVFSRPGPSKIGLAKTPEKGEQTNYRDLPPGDKRTKEKVKFELPYSYFEDADKYDMREDLSQSNIPKLFFVGLHDKDVEPQLAREAYEVSAPPKELYELNCIHDYRTKPEMIKEVNRTVADFLAKYP